MKILKLSVDYDGNYGGSIHEYCLLPIEWNGLYVETLNCGTHKGFIGLGEIEGKHSDVYGDLTVEKNDLSKLSNREISELIKGSSVDEFESTFESWESDFYYDDEAFLEAHAKFEKLNGIEFKSKWQIKSAIISENLITKLSSQLEDFAEISVKASDKYKAILLLQDNGIEVFE